VLFKKTRIIEPMSSFLIEISLIDDRLLVTAYGMGTGNHDCKLLVSKEKTSELLQEVKSDYSSIWDRVSVSMG
jgi:hypothetical protein